MFSEMHISMPTFDGTVMCFFSIFTIFNVEVVNAEFSLSHSDHPCVATAEGWKVLQQIAALGDDCSIQWEGVSNVHVWL